MVIANPKDDSVAMGILAFEAAAAMSCLVSLHLSLSDSEISQLRAVAMRSQGVAYLNSTDQSFLIRLACAETVENLDRAAEVVSRLSCRCRAALPTDFDKFYTELRTGSIDPNCLGLKYAGKSIEKRVKKMEKYVALTAKLYEEIELLNEMEATEQRKWRRSSGPIPMQKGQQQAGGQVQLDIKSQLQKVRRLKEESLWSQPFDKAVDIMALATYTIFARICVVFGPFVPGLPRIVACKESSRISFVSRRLRLLVSSQSGPLERTCPQQELPMRNSCPILGTRNVNHWSKMLNPPPHTVGGSGLSLLYANVIVQAENVMLEGEAPPAEEREELYNMLPLGLKSAVRAKLRECWRERGPSDGDLATGWKDAIWRILGWLGPVAQDTLQWQAERTMERRQRFESQPRTLMLRTLHFSDREKTEAAIAEVLVGLSLVCWYDEACYC